MNRKTNGLHTALGTLLLVLALGSGPAIAQTLPTTALGATDREATPHKFAGIVLAYNSGQSSYAWRGSGSVARHPKIVVSCAHVVYGETAWHEGDFRWFWKWPNSSQPSASQGMLMRGAVRWASYHTEKRNDISRGIGSGSSSSNAFDYDITALWSFENTASGGYAGWYSDGRAAMKSSREKMITGYPARPFGTWNYSMYRTGPFTNAFAEVGKYGGGLTSRYMRPNRESVNLGGNSGGPLWVIDSNGQWGQAGVFVSGSTGVTGLDAAAWNVVVEAINNSGGTPPPPPPPAPVDDHSNTTTNATLLTLGTARAGVLETGGDLDFFRFTAPSTGDFVIESTGSTDMFGSLLSSSSSVIAEDDDSGTDYNFRITRRLAAGTYYVRARGYSTSTTGSYAVRVTQTTVVAPEIEITGLSSRVITDGDTSPDSADGTQFGTLPTSGGSVTRTFTVLNRGNDVLSLNGSPRVSLSGTGASQFSVSTQPASSVAAGSNTTFTVTFQPGSHGAHHATVSIANNDADENPYDFAITGTRTPPANTDGHGESFTNFFDLGRLTGGSSWSVGNARIDYGGDEDYFRFEVVQTAQYSIQTKGAIDTYGYLYNGSRSLLLQDDDSGDNVNFLLVRQLTPGIYFIRVRGYSSSVQGDYRLEIRATQPGPEINIATPDLTPVPDGSTTPSVVTGTDFGSVLHASGTVERAFRVENFGSANLLLSGSPLVQLSGSGAAHFQIVASPSTSIAPGGFTTFRLRFSPTLPGTHTATVTLINNDADENPFDFTIRGIGTGAVDDHGNTPETARSVSLPSTTSGVIERGGDIDVFRFTVASSRTVTLRSTGSTDMVVHLLNSSGREIAQNDDGDGYPNFRLSQVLHPGTYYARVRAFGSGTTGAYQFLLEAGALLAPDFYVTGISNRLIPASETTASTSTGTHFGRLNTLGGVRDRSFALRNRGVGAVNLTGTPLVRIVGPDAAAFTVTRQPLATVASRGSTLLGIRFDPRREGWHQATVEIPSNDSTNPVYRFAVAGEGVGYVPLYDDHGDTNLSATAVAATSNTAGNLGHEGDNDWFTFSVAVESFVTIETTGITDTFGHWYNAAGRQIAFDDDSGQNLNMGMAATVPAGTYRLRVRGFSRSNTGPYTLSIQSQTAIPNLFVTSRYYDDIPSGSTAINTWMGTDFGAVNYRSGYRNAVFRMSNFGNGTLALGTPRITLTGPGAAHFRVAAWPAQRLAPGAATAFTLRYDPSGSGEHLATVQIHSNDPDTNPYTFTVRGFGQGPVTTDDHGNSIGTATWLPSNGSLAGQLERGGDIDFFRIDVASASQLTLHATSNIDTYGRLYDAFGSEIAYDDDSGDNLNFRVVANVSAGTYYLRVSGYSNLDVGQYQVFASTGTPAPDDHGNTFGTATSISMGGSRAGVIQAGDVDVFTFTLTSAQAVRLRTTGTMDTYGELYNSSGTLLASDDDSGTDLNFDITHMGLPSGTYYVRVRGYSSSTTGSYTLFLSVP